MGQNVLYIPSRSLVLLTDALPNTKSPRKFPNCGDSKVNIGKEVKESRIREIHERDRALNTHNVQE